MTIECDMQSGLAPGLKKKYEEHYWDMTGLCI